MSKKHFYNIEEALQIILEPTTDSELSDVELSEDEEDVSKSVPQNESKANALEEQNTNEEIDEILSENKEIQNKKDCESEANNAVGGDEWAVSSDGEGSSSGGGEINNGEIDNNTDDNNILILIKLMCLSLKSVFLLGMQSHHQLQILNLHVKTFFSLVKIVTLGLH